MCQRQYKAFLLRLQRDESHSQWRATIENAQTGERLRFANQNQMLRYLLNDLAQNPSTDDAPTNQENRGEN